jgi:hypothetical protein
MNAPAAAPVPAVPEGSPAAGSAGGSEKEERLRASTRQAAAGAGKYAEMDAGKGAPERWVWM